MARHEDEWVCVECGTGLNVQEHSFNEGLCNQCKRVLEEEMADGGFDPFSDDFCDDCLLPSDACTCPREPVIDDMEANTRGDIA